MKFDVGQRVRIVNSRTDLDGFEGEITEVKYAQRGYTVSLDNAGTYNWLEEELELVKEPKLKYVTKTP